MLRAGVRRRMVQDSGAGGAAEKCDVEVLRGSANAEAPTLG